ncbi:anaphase-promoting complex subunit cdc27, partial [Coemansia sp. RSA 2618]
AAPSAATRTATTSRNSGKCAKHHTESDLGRPPTEAVRHHYERLIHRGISLLQPHSVLFVAEAYHGWYHSTSTDVAGSILQTVGRASQTLRIDSEAGADGGDTFDVRSVYWLALCHWHLGEVSSAYALLGALAVEAEDVLERGGGESGSAGESAAARATKALACGLWLLALACARLEKWQEAEDHLQALLAVLRLLHASEEPGAADAEDMRRVLRGDMGLYAVPQAADVSDQLALVCLRTNRHAQSEAHSGDALRRNPLLWSSFRRLCDQGSAQLAQALAVTIDDSAQTAARKKSPVMQAELTPVPAAARKPAVPLRQPVGQRPQLGRGRPAELSDSATNPRVHTRLSSRAPVARANINGSKGSVAPLSAKTPARSRASVLAASEKKRTRNGATVRSSTTTTARMREPSLATAAREGAAGPNSELQDVASIHGLLKSSALAYMHAAGFRASQALAAFAGLPHTQQNSVWGLCVLGRICFEAGRYPEAARAFGAAHSAAPYRVRDMDTYSTLLWHMKREETLAALAHAMVGAGRNWSPEAWVAVANCFSLDGDHAAALKSLTRSIQLHQVSGPRSDAGGVGGLAYAHTLVGHESVAVDDLDRAQRAFRTAIRIDARHYNAWYGLGLAYLRLGKPDLAEYHFKRALALNSQNPLLLQSAGAVYEFRKDYPRALRVYERVERMLDGSSDKGKGKANERDSEDKDNVDNVDDSEDAALAAGADVILGQHMHHAMNFVMFKRARVLVVLERFSAAARVLEQLLRRCPREFNVPFLLGQTYSKLRRYREAAACLTRALDIAPENAQSVREAFDALYLQDAEDREAELDDMDNSENSIVHPEPPYSQDTAMHTPSGGLVENILTSSSEVGSPYFDSP